MVVRVGAVVVVVLVAVRVGVVLVVVMLVVAMPLEVIARGRSRW